MARQTRVRSKYQIFQGSSANSVGGDTKPPFLRKICLISSLPALLSIHPSHYKLQLLNVQYSNQQPTYEKLYKEKEEQVPWKQHLAKALGDQSSVLMKLATTMESLRVSMLRKFGRQRKILRASMLLINSSIEEWLKINKELMTIAHQPNQEMEAEESANNDNKERMGLLPAMLSSITLQTKCQPKTNASKGS
ncbi:hypothetical protein DPMN_091368 [Dreissena polymorpha]|uniref:Uncharacterized protein n=1 Tax=Dreissena polymorpha TaxID=45954 RepID=A0A9D4QZW9_DREPO|nr:hypothetical protein DPMN_091368 [Dreissena polymorpha]